MKRIAKWLRKETGYPISHQTWSILHYKPGQYYPEHHDGHNNFYTCYIYLNKVDGGETTFPNANVKLKGVVGRGMLWQNYKLSSFCGLPYLRKDMTTIHHAKPPKSGEVKPASRSTNREIHEFEERRMRSGLVKSLSFVNPICTRPSSVSQYHEGVTWNKAFWNSRIHLLRDSSIRRDFAGTKMVKPSMEVS